MTAAVTSILTAAKVDAGRGESADLAPNTIGSSTDSHPRMMVVKGMPFHLSSGEGDHKLTLPDTLTRDLRVRKGHSSC